MTNVLDKYNVLGGRERNQGRKEKNNPETNPTKNNQERERKVKISMFSTALSYPGGAKLRRNFGALGK